MRGEVVKIDFPATGIYAFGIHITEPSGTGNWCIDLTPRDRALTTSSAAGPSNVQFFGFVSNAPITAPLYIHYAVRHPHHRAHEL